MKRNIERIVIYILKNINNNDYSMKEQIELLSKINKIYQVMYENDDYGYSFETLYLINSHLSYLYEKIGELEKSKKHYNYSNQFIENLKIIDNNYKHTSLLFKKLKCRTNKLVVKKIKKLDYKIIKDTNC